MSPLYEAHEFPVLELLLAAMVSNLSYHFGSSTLLSLSIIYLRLYVSVVVTRTGLYIPCKDLSVEHEFSAHVIEVTGNESYCLVCYLTTFFRFAPAT